MRAILFAVAIVLGGCAAVPDATMCAHCACGPADRGLARPLLCSTMQRETECCPAIVPPTS